MRLVDLTKAQEIKFMSGEEEIVVESPSVYDLRKSSFAKPALSIRLMNPIVKGKIYEERTIRKTFNNIDEVLEFSKSITRDSFEGLRANRITTIPFVDLRYKLLYNDTFIEAFVNKEKDEIFVDGYRCILGGKKLYLIMNKEGDILLENKYDNLGNLIYSKNENEMISSIFENRTCIDEVYRSRRKNAEFDSISFKHTDILSPKLHMQSKIFMGSHDPSAILWHQKNIVVLNDGGMCDYAYAFDCNDKRNWAIKNNKSSLILPIENKQEKIKRFNVNEEFDDGSVIMEALYIVY